MTVIDKNKMHKDLCDKLNKIHYDKSCDYGDSFGETFNKLGIISAITRISDKYNRLTSLCMLPEEERKVKDESITDTLLDMANYCMMTVIELEKDKLCNCDHELEYVATNVNEFDLQTYENHICKKCGMTKKMNVM